MDYNFGEIYDARKAPAPLGHFIILLGETRKGEVMYYLVTSRVYAVFRDLISFFDDCLRRKDTHFLRSFSKEKNKTSITPHGNLMDALFLDKYNCYTLCLNVDSMIVLNSEPQLLDKSALETLRRDQKIVLKDALSDMDTHKLMAIIKHSRNISPMNVSQISVNFNKVIKEKRVSSSSTRR